MLNTLALDPLKLRGVAVVSHDVSVGELERLHAAGVRGIRCNIVDLKFGKGQLPLEELHALAERIKPLGWHVEFLMHTDEFPELDRQLAAFPVPVVFGHLGYVATSKGGGSAGFRAMLRLAKDGKAWVKLTAPYRLTPSQMPYPDVDDTARELVETIPDRLVWGSDWPHVFIKSPIPNDGDLLDLLAHWVPDTAQRHRILVSNPTELYDF
jgi:2-pyrone-4,6-dicarboxylate lactonase